MAKRKAASTRKAAPKKTATGRAKARSGARTTTARKAPKKTAAKKSATKRPSAKAAKVKASPKRMPSKAKASKRAAAKPGKVAVRKAAPRKPAPKKPAAVAKAVKAIAKPVAKAVVKKAPAKAVPVKAAAAKPKTSEQVTGTHVPHIFRERRTIADDDVVPTPPSSLDLDQSASSARSGGRGLADRIRKHTDTSPALTAGDVDADWESAESSGEEAPGGDNPTPDQDVVDEIGHALGLDYDEDEELDTEGKLTERDDHRWELDPESSEDFEDR